MPSDTLTFLVFAALLMTFLGLLQIWLWRQDRALSVLGTWGAAHLIGAAGLAMAASRHWLPERLSIDATSALLALAYGLVWAGARRLEKRPVRAFIVVGGAVVWLLSCELPWLHLGEPARIAGGACIFAAYHLLTMREFLQQRSGPALPSRHALGATFGVLAIMQIVRAALSLSRGVVQDLSGLPVSPWFNLSAMVGAVLMAGTSVLLIAVAKEAAEQRVIATMALARDAANRANAAKSRFLARMSHELRTPLNGVLGMAQALTQDPMVRGGQRQRAILLEQAGRHLLAIVNDLQAIASVEADRFELAPRPVRLREIIQGGVDLVAETATTRHVALDLAIAEDAPEAVLADPVRVRQIIVNLLANAIRFAPFDSRVKLVVEPAASWIGVCLSVIDAGPGVPVDMVPDLFEEFAQRPIAGGPIEGTGLGLAISAALVRAMHGTIAYRPAPQGSGSMFIIELPLPRVEPPAALPERSLEVPGTRQGLTVLVVDDVASNRKVAEAFLRQAGIAVLLAEDGDSAIAALQRGPVPDVILMDIYMPGMNGLDAARAIRAMPGDICKVPIIALTADIGMEQADACRSAGMSSYLSKPLDISELFAAIAEAVPSAPVPAPGRPVRVGSFAER